MSLQVSSLHKFFFFMYWWQVWQAQCLFSLWLAAQEPATQENGDTDIVPRKCDIITITGRTEKCDLAHAALLVRNLFVRLWLSCFPAVEVWIDFIPFLPLPVTPKALVPVTIDVEVPYDLHRYIIGQKGSGIRKMMEDYEVCHPELLLHNRRSTFKLLLEVCVSVLWCHRWIFGFLSLSNSQMS